MAKAVLYHWGVRRTGDIGTLVYNMIGKGILARTDGDSPDDFKDVYDFEEVFNGVILRSIT